MSRDGWAYAAVLAMALVLPVAALRGSRMSLGTAAKMAAAWAAIFVVAAIVFSSLDG